MPPFGPTLLLVSQAAASRNLSLGLTECACWDEIFVDLKRKVAFPNVASLENEMQMQESTLAEHCWLSMNTERV